MVQIAEAEFRRCLDHLDIKDPRAIMWVCQLPINHESNWHECYQEGYCPDPHPDKILWKGKVKWKMNL
jgi:hypothetical protein